MFIVHVGRRMSVIPIVDLSHGRLALSWPQDIFTWAFISFMPGLQTCWPPTAFQMAAYSPLVFTLYTLCCRIVLWNYLILFILYYTVLAIIKYYPNVEQSLYEEVLIYIESILSVDELIWRGVDLDLI